MNSLQGRQLLSSLVIVGLGIILLGSIVFYVFQKNMFIDEKNVLRETIVNLMPYLEYENEQFKTDYSEKNELLAFLKINNLADIDSDTFVYIQNVKSRNIIWHSHYPLTDISSERFAKNKREVFTTFKLSPFIGQEAMEILFPETEQGRNKSKLDGSKRFIVYARSISSDKSKYLLIMAKSSKSLEKGKNDLAKIIILLFVITALLVLASQRVSSYLVITPIKEFQKEIHKIESGDQQLIVKQYPKELAAVKGAVNALINSEKGQKQRYRDALDDLAHSLKTPLSVLQNSAERNHDETIESQVQRMDDIIAYQLRRAVVSEHGGIIIKQQAIRPVLYRIKDSLLKSYRDKPFEFIINVDEYMKCRMEQDDMMEVFGNLINNACRFCERIVEITATKHADMVIIDIDDDGMGFPAVNPEELLQRGIRADSQSEGQGIGLAVSTEIVTALGGKIELTISPHVGARVRLHLPT